MRLSSCPRRGRRGRREHKRRKTESNGHATITDTAAGALCRLSPQGILLCSKTRGSGKESCICGDIGCYTLGNAMPLDMVDTCLCMGADVTMAQGLHRIEPDTLNFAFIGDSVFRLRFTRSDQRRI